MEQRDCQCRENALKVVNIGLPRFYDAIVAQNIKAVQVDWRPPVKQSQEIEDLLDMFI